MKCERCNDCGWVCENHRDKPWDGEGRCKCGGAGDPCPNCNPADAHNPPRDLSGFKIITDKDGSRH